MTQGRANQPPPLNDGDSLFRVRAAEWRRVIAAVTTVENVSGDLVRRHGDRIEISSRFLRGGAGGGGARSDTITVAIIQKPTATSKRLRVREVQYIGNDGPTTDSGAPYKFNGQAFDALPYIGKRAVEYEGFEFTGSTPTQDVTYFDARSIGEGRWIVSAPQAGSESVAMAFWTGNVGQVGGSNQTGFLEVRRIKMVIDTSIPSNPAWRYEIVGAPELVATWPNTSPSDYVGLQGGFPGFSDFTPILLIVKVAGVWHAMQTLVFLVGQPPPGVVEANCT